MALRCQSAEPLPDAQAGSPGGPGPCGTSQGQHRHGDGETSQSLEKLKFVEMTSSGWGPKEEGTETVKCSRGIYLRVV